MDRAGSIAARFAALSTEPGLVRLDGIHPLKHALRFGGAVELAVSPDKAGLLDLARELCPDLEDRLRDLVLEVPPKLFAALGPPPPSPVLAIARRPAIEPSALLASVGPAPLLLLDRPVHAGNLGAVVRVAAALDAAGVVVLGGVDPWSPVALRAAAGLQFALPVVRLEKLPEPIRRPLVALHPEGPPLDVEPLPAGALFAFGTERHGLDPALRARADAVRAIPMRPGVSSLNLATAVAIMLWEARRLLPSSTRAG